MGEYAQVSLIEGGTVVNRRWEADKVRAQTFPDGRARLAPEGSSVKFVYIRQYEVIEIGEIEAKEKQ